MGLTFTFIIQDKTKRQVNNLASAVNTTNTRFWIEIFHSNWLNLGATQIWLGQECAAKDSKPIPLFKGHFDRKRNPLLRDFSQNRENLEKWTQV